jgi:hypothetical protein
MSTIFESQPDVADSLCSDDSEVSGDREVQRTMLELLNQLDGFSSDERIKVGTAAPQFPSSLITQFVIYGSLTSLLLYKCSFAPY